MYTKDFLNLAKYFGINYFPLSKTDKFAKGCPCNPDKHHGYIHNVITNDMYVIQVPLCIPCIKKRTNIHEFIDWIISEQQCYTVKEREINPNPILKGIIKRKLDYDESLDTQYKISHIVPELNNFINSLENLKIEKAKSNPYKNIYLDRKGFAKIYNAVNNLTYNSKNYFGKDKNDITPDFSVLHLVKLILGKYVIDVREYELKGGVCIADKYLYKFIIKTAIEENDFVGIMRLMRLAKEGKLAKLNMGSDYINYQHKTKEFYDDVNAGKVKQY